MSQSITDMDDFEVAPTPKKKYAKKAKSASTPAPADDPVADSALPAAYASKSTKPSTSALDDIDLTETFIESLPGKDSIPGLGLSGQARDHRDYVDVPKDEDGNDLLDFRFCDKRRAGRAERNLAKGFVPLWVKDRQPVPAGTPGAAPVTVGGADLLVRRASVAKARRKDHDARALALVRKERERPDSSDIVAQSRGTVEVTKETKAQSHVIQPGTKVNL